MTRYMLSVHTADGAPRVPPSAEEMQHSWQQIGALEAEMKSSGAWVFSGRLHEPDTATVVRVDNGDILTTDGPFVETREHLGGFYKLWLVLMLIKPRSTGSFATIPVDR